MATIDFFFECQDHKCIQIYLSYVLVYLQKTDLKEKFPNMDCLRII